MDQPVKRLKQVALRCVERFYQLERKLFEFHLEAVQERRHLQPGTIERSYYTAGYLQALKDVRHLVDEGEFPTTLAIDGGPRIANSVAPEKREHGQSQEAPVLEL